MAALLDPVPYTSRPELWDLRRLTADDLHPLLTEEARVWREQMSWDFERSAELVRKFIQLRALNGSALMLRGAVAGYSYFVFEDHKGLIGDLYLREGFQTAENVKLLLAGVVKGLIATSQVRRIESQLMMIGHIPNAVSPRASSVERHMQLFEREFMVADLNGPDLLPSKQQTRFLIERWEEHHQEPAAHVIASAYRDHIDSQINDQYRSVAGARKFLYNIVQYPGCGAFFRPASAAAYDMATGYLCGISLTSLVEPDCGHITQICVNREVRGAKVGYELLRSSLQGLRDHGCRRASLTVTSANTEAIQLYERVGFRSIRRFPACVWEGF